MMKYVLRLSLAFVVFYFAYDWLFAHYLPESHFPSRIVWPSFLMLLPFSMFFGLFYNFRRYNVIRSSDNTVPQDGKWTALSGTITPSEAPLVSPLTKKECVCYSYSISS